MGREESGRMQRRMGLAPCKNSFRQEKILRFGIFPVTLPNFRSVANHLIAIDLITVMAGKRFG
jgi:hypothetical protein